MPIEVRELHIKSNVPEPEAVVHVMFLPDGVPLRARTSLPGKKATYPNVAAFASGLRTLGVSPGMKLDITVLGQGGSGAAPSSHPPGHVPPKPPVPLPSTGPVMFAPSASDVQELERIVRRSGYSNITLKRGTFRSG